MVRMSTTPGLFLETLRTINTILIQNAAREPFKSMLLLAQERLARRDLAIAVYRGRPEIEVDHFTARFEDGQVEMIMRGRQTNRTD